MFSFKRLLKIGLFLTFLSITVIVALYFSMRSSLPNIESLKDIQWQTPMRIYSHDGKLINQFGEKKRIPLTLDETPQQLINALLATEDDRFYLHFGVDPIGMARAIFGQIMGKNKGGASTITMQVARNFFLTREQTYIRKLREIFLSFHIESLLTKDEILTLYINKIPLGHRSYGFGAAAQVYYGKHPKELTLAQLAVLAGLPKAPSSLNPIRSPEKAKARRTVVLQRMLVSGYITEAEQAEANQAPITGKMHGAEIELNAPYIAEIAHQKMIERYGKEEAYTGGYKVFTTVPSKLQKAAQQAVIENLMTYDQRHGYRGAIMSLKPELTESQPTTANVQPSSSSELISAEKINQALAYVNTYQSLVPAVVTEVFENSVTITLPEDLHETIEWSGLSWARQYINDQKQGPAPKSAKDILSYGDVIYVMETPQGFVLSQLPEASSALVSISPDNGAIKAAVGGFSFLQSQFNRVTQAKRQAGSNIKPFIYSAALEHGFTLATLVNDAPINKWDSSGGSVWRPKNSPPKYNGEIRVRLALALSKNVIAVRLLREVGLDNIIRHLSSFGFSPDDLPHNETLALGSAALTPLEVVTGFATFANGGFLIQPYLIGKIEDSFGNVLYQAPPVIACDPCDEAETETIQAPLQTSQNGNTSIHASGVKSASPTIIKAERVISSQNAFLVTEALNSAIWGADWRLKPYWQGTGWRAQTLKRRDIAGKTGTTNQSKDAWFSGFSRRLVTTTWIGFDDPERELGKTTYNSNLGKNQITGLEAGAKSAQPAWINFMQTALADIPVEPFQQPLDIVSVRIDKATGKLTTKTDETSQFEYFQLGTTPTEYISNDHSGEILDGALSDENDIF